MPDYKKMYHTLFNQITDIIDELQAVQRQTEEMYISDDKQIIEFTIKESNENIMLLLSKNKFIHSKNQGISP